jgi:acyl carrier protein
MDEQAYVLGELCRIMAAELGGRPVGPDDDLVADLGLDSLTMTAVVVAIEDRFALTLCDGDAVGVRTVAELARRVVARRAAASASASAPASAP